MPFPLSKIRPPRSPTDYIESFEIVVGTDSSFWNYPLKTSYHDARTQSLYLAGQLGGANTFVGLGLDVSTIPGQTMNNFTIRLKHSDLSVFNSQSEWESSDWTTVYQSSETITSTGWAVFAFTTPFTYNGTQNLIVDISFNNSSYDSDGYCRVSSYGRDSRSLYYYTDSGYGDPLNWSARTPVPKTSYYAPNLKLILPQPVVLTADLDGSSAVNMADFALFAEHWLDTCTTPDWCSGTDFNQSGLVNVDDLTELLDSWLE